MDWWDNEERKIEKLKQRLHVLLLQSEASMKTPEDEETEGLFEHGKKEIIPVSAGIVDRLIKP